MTQRFLLILIAIAATGSTGRRTRRMASTRG
jgi:hypothetical protein